jgi:hypothetical protein
MPIIPIRCQNKKRHSIYNEFGALIGAIDDDFIYFRCPSCRKNEGKWFKVYRDENGGLVQKRMPKNFILNFDDEIKKVI